MADTNKEFLQKLLAMFRTESEEHLREIVSNIVLLEQTGADAHGELMERVLKRLHTLKGAARAVNLGDLEAICHAMEGVLSASLTSRRKLVPAQFDLLHQGAIIARELSSEPSGRARNRAIALISGLDALNREIAASAPDIPEAAPQDEARAEDDDTAMPVETLRTDLIRVQGKHLDAIRYQAESLLRIDLELQHEINDLIQLAAEMEVKDTLHARETATPVRIAGKRMRGPQRRSDAAERITDQDSGRYAQRCRSLASALNGTRRQFAAIRSRLMDATLETAMVPLASALDQLPGLVRNLARSRAKEVVLDVRGEQIQIDRRILDIVREALIHLVTNAVDHGIEPVDRRQAAGKAAAGTVRIHAVQRGGNHVALLVTDDGAGIDTERIIDAAVRSGKVGAEEIAGLSAHKKLQLALHAGVSTIAHVTPVSGRGMGLAVVADKAASVGGSLHIDNAAGQGCTFELSLPVRLATLKGLVVRVRGNRYVLPVSDIESVRALGDEDIQTVEQRETLLAGERVLPVIRLGQILRVQRPESEPGNAGVALFARDGRHCFALHVDEILSEQEVLPKNLGKQLRRVRYVTGAAQLGDGSLIPILGLEDIARYGLAAGNAATQAASEAPGGQAGKRLLVVEDSITSRLLLKHILEGAGYQVDTAVDGLDALTRLRHAQFDAVVSDVEMPQLGGLELTEQIRSNPKTEDMPVILVTSLQSPEEKERGLRAGADAYVVKGSFDQDNLLATVRRLI